MKADYWEGKYNRFIMEEVPKSFKNSQLVDTGIITKYAMAYLKSVFGKVFSVKGKMVDVFRKAWGLHESYIDEQGRVFYEEKNRDTYIHHCVDAITIACMSKNKYDNISHAWYQEEIGKKNDARKAIENSKPWSTYSQDVKNIVNEVLVTHYTPYNVSKQSKKKVRKRGAIQYHLEFEKDKNGKRISKKDKKGNLIFKLDKKGQKIPIYQQGETVRNSLHLETYYGAINSINNDETNKNKKVVKAENIRYVTRDFIKNLSDSDLKKIVDKRIREIVIEARKKEKVFKDEIESIEKQIKQANKDEEKDLINERNRIKDLIKNDLYVIPPKKGKNKGTPIRKVRLFSKIKNPIHLKKHKDFSQSKKHDYKRYIYVSNEENIKVAVYRNESDGKFSYSDYPINPLELSKEKKHKESFNKTYKGKNFFCMLKKGDLVLFFEKHPDEININDYSEISKRLYKVIEIPTGGRIKFKLHNEARNDKKIKEDFIKQYGVNFEKTLVSGMKKFDLEKMYPKLNISPINFNFIPLNKGVYKISITGKIEKTK